MSAFEVESNDSYLVAVPTDGGAFQLSATDAEDAVWIALRHGIGYSHLTMTIELDPSTAMELAGWLFNWALRRMDATDHTTTVGEALRRLVKK